MGKELKKLIVPIIVSVVLSGLTAYLLSPAGPVNTYLSLDLTYLVGPIIGFLVLRLGHRVSTIVMPGLAGKLLSYSLGGASFAVLLYAFLNWASHISGIEETPFSHINELGGYAILLVAGITIRGLANLLQAQVKLDWISPAVDALAFMLIGLSILFIARPFTETWEYATSVGTAFLVGFLLSSIASLADYGRKSTNRFVADICRWATESHFLMFIIGVLLYSYLALIRPLIADSFSYTPLVEWGIVCLVAWRVYRGIRNTIRERHSATLQLSTWEKHSQEVQEIVDTELAYLSTIQKDFVEKGQRSSLITNLVVMLYENGWDINRIGNTLTRLINHEDQKVPWYAFIWDENHIKHRNEEERKKVLSEIIDNVIQQPRNKPENVEVKV